ncbi:hypothetical protein [Micromonospora sp. NPDC049679]|uniref:hypothetical protein n=1 Tax=Micromonospora sp. NPDC049679 TaxID=3155920 RepID=UPI0033E7C21C
MTACAERGVSAPPEVVFNTATDPDRTSAWLPEQVRGTTTTARPAATADDLRARWGAETGWPVALQVHPGEAGGAMVRLELAGDVPHDELAELAKASLVNLAREVADNLTPG